MCRCDDHVRLSCPVQAEAALAQSDFNIDKILEIQNKFTGGTVRRELVSDGVCAVALQLPHCVCCRPSWCPGGSSFERECCGKSVGKGPRNDSFFSSMTYWYA